MSFCMVPFSEILISSQLISNLKCCDNFWLVVILAVVTSHLLDKCILLWLTGLVLVSIITQIDIINILSTQETSWQHHFPHIYFDLSANLFEVLQLDSLIFKSNHCYLQTFQMNWTRNGYGNITVFPGSHGRRISIEAWP